MAKAAPPEEEETVEPGEEGMVEPSVAVMVEPEEEEVADLEPEVGAVETLAVQSAQARFLEVVVAVKQPVKVGEVV